MARPLRLIDSQTAAEMAECLASMGIRVDIPSAMTVLYDAIAILRGDCPECGAEFHNAHSAARCSRAAEPLARCDVVEDTYAQLPAEYSRRFSPESHAPMPTRAANEPEP